ncbi:MAG TPA: hypothetical protein VK900_15285 [Anaerolineales bacterium]|nr:hypothetical protein [Anaerolineales bacterium]
MDPVSGEVLRRAWQIIRANRALWVLGGLPLVPFLLYLPLVAYLFLSKDFMNDIPRLVVNPGFLMSLLIVVLIMGVLSFVLQAFSRAAITFGIIRLEQSRDPLTVREMSRGGRKFFQPMLRAMLLTSLCTLLFLAASSLALSLIGFVTLGLGSVLGQFLFWPATLLVHAVIEQSHSAVVADGIQPMDAIRRAGELVQENLGIFAPVTLILYIATALLASLATLPVTAPLLILVLGTFAGDVVDSSFLQIALFCFVAFIPLYLITQAILTSYIRSVHVVTYLRLTRSPLLQSLPETREASS